MKLKIIFQFVIGLLLTTSLISFQSVSSRSQESCLKTLTVDNYDMVIISTNDFFIPLQLLIEHKNSHGVMTIFKDIKEIYDQYTGRDEQEQIKYFIKDAIETLGVSYVFLVGGIDYVPIRKSAINYLDGMRSHEYLPTDLYYADIYNSKGDFCSWDANNNNVFGEYYPNNIDGVDCYPDVYIGRIPCFNSAELEVVVNKIIKYEDTAFGSEWFNRVLLLAGQFYGDQETTYSNMIGGVMEDKDFELTKLYTYNSFKPKNINSEVTKGAGFLHYKGHGNYICIAAYFNFHLPFLNRNFSRRITYYNRYLSGMNNGYMLPIAYFDACSTATLDPISGKYPLLKEILNIPDKAGFAYNIVKKEGGGAIAAIGATRPSGGSHLGLYFFMNYDDGINLGEMFAKGQITNLNSGDDTTDWRFHVCQMYNLFGDPSLKVGGYPLR